MVFSNLSSKLCSSHALAILLQHGEPGATVVDIQLVNVVVSHVLQQILSTVCIEISWKSFDGL